MERITLTSLLLSAMVSLSAGALRQHHFVNQSLSWTDAQNHCRQKHTDLLTITDTQDQIDTEQVIKRVNAGADRMWIGLRSTVSWIWSLSDHKFYTANEFQYRKWETSSKQPQGEGDCVFMNKYGNWYDASCNTTTQFICYNASEGFVRVPELKTWTEAQRYCREIHTDLASVRNDSENDKIQSIIAENPPTPDTAWIGLHRRWVWSDNSTSTFTHWRDGQPSIREKRDDICASIDIPQGRWIDEKCTAQHPFVCYDNNLVLVRESLTWTDALRYCRDRDMDLVSVDSEEIQLEMKSVTASASSAHVWLGLRHSCVVGLWFWVNGQTVCYDRWAPGHGTGEEDCTTTVRSGAIQTSDQRWISLPETERNNFICIK